MGFPFRFSVQLLPLFDLSSELGDVPNHTQALPSIRDKLPET